ncbi:hypothetical protein LJC49_09660 [Ruminococcaceae bacterium OttesenSCG-928-I18]|nr:hypothetical protein [Ruminococcaceae bacterium OttesenSCG-928-I18]
MISNDKRNLEVFQLCIDLIDKTTVLITTKTNQLNNLMAFEERERLPSEIRKYISDIRPCFDTANSLRDSMGDRLPYNLQKQFGIKSNAYYDAVRMFNLSQRG